MAPISGCVAIRWAASRRGATGAGGGTTVGPAERVAIMRNLEFSAGGRSALVAGGPVSANQANISERTGQVQIHGTHDATSSTAGNVQHDQPAQPASVSHDSAD